MKGHSSHTSRCPSEPDRPQTTSAPGQTRSANPCQSVHAWCASGCRLSLTRKGTALPAACSKPAWTNLPARTPTSGWKCRIKALEGAGGLLEILVAANVAAPLALPDLVLLPRPTLESAALKDLLYPYDGLTNIMDDASWFEYARQLAHVQSSTYGIPFAGDAMVLAYHPSSSSNPTTRPGDFSIVGRSAALPGN